MKTLTFLLSTILEFYTMALLLRIWIQWNCCDLYNPLAQFIFRLTQTIVEPFYKISPKIKNFDSASLVVAFLLSVLKVAILFATVNLSVIIWVAGILVLIKTIGILIFWILTAMAIMSWFSQCGKNSANEQLLSQLTDPLLRPIKNLLPLHTGGIDFSQMILVMILYIINVSISEILQITGNLILSSLWTAL